MLTLSTLSSKSSGERLSRCFSATTTQSKLLILTVFIYHEISSSKKGEHIAAKE